MADVVVTLSGDEAALLKSLQKIIDKQKQVDEGLDKTKNKGKEAKESFSKFGDEARSALDPMQLTSYVTGLVSITGAINAAVKVWQEYKQAQQDALQSSERLKEEDRKLAQVAETGQLPALFKQADDIATSRGIDRGKARDLLFSAISDGFFGDVERVARASDVVDINEASVVAGQTRGLFKNDKVSVDEALSMTLKAAQVSRLDFGPMAKSLPSAAEGAAQINSTLAETLAAQGILASVFKSGDSSADRIKAFASRAALDPATKSLGLLGAFDYVNALPEAERADWLGQDQEKNAVFNAMRQNITQIRNLESQIQADKTAVASGGGMLNERIADANSTPQIAYRRLLSASQIAAEIATEKRFAESGYSDEITQNDVKRMLDETGQGFLRRTATRLFSPAWTMLGADAKQQAQLSQYVFPTDINARNMLTMPMDYVRGTGHFAQGPQFQTTQEMQQSMEQASRAAAQLRDNLQGAADSAKVQAARAQAAAGTQP